MKKRICFVIGLSCIYFLSACSKAEDKENLFEMPSLQGQENTELSSEAFSEAGMEDDIEYYDTEDKNEFTLSEEYQYGNMQKNAPPGNFMKYKDQIVFLYHDGHNSAFTLYELDPKTSEVHMFCKDATCTHNSEKCSSGGALANLEQYNGNLYAMSGGWQIMELRDGQFEQITDGAVYNFWHAGDNLYAVSKDGSLIVFEDGSRKPRILVEEYTDIWNVVFDRYLYGCTGQGISRVDLLAENPQKEILVQSGYSMIDGEHIYYFDNKSFYLFRCNMDGSNPVQLTEQPVLPASINFDGEYVYFCLYINLEMGGEGNHDIYRMQKKDPHNIEKIAELSNDVYTIYTVPDYDKLIVVTSNDYADGTQNELCVVAKDGSSVEKLEIPGF